MSDAVGIGRGAQVIGVAVCSLSLSWISVALRFYVRIKILKRFGWEDWLTVASMILFTILCSLFLEVINYGLGRHMVDIPPDDMPIAHKYIFICELLYVATTAVTKMSIGVYFLRLSSKRYQVFIIHTTMIVVIFFSTIYFFFLVFQCHPVAYLWTQYYGDTGSCLKGSVLANVTYAHAAMSAVTDWSFGILPVFFVRKMKMDLRTKLSITLILSLGFFASTATIVRIVYIRRLTLTTDYSYEGINLVKWSMVEPAIGITAAAIATLRPLFKAFFSRKRPNGANRLGTNPSTNRSQSESHYEGRSSSGQDSYTSEFGALLGLETRGAVTTVIYATNQPSQRMSMGWVLNWRRKRPGMVNEFPGSSQTELRSKASDDNLSNSDWIRGITKTTVITTDGKDG